MRHREVSLALLSLATLGACGQEFSAAIGSDAAPADGSSVVDAPAPPVADGLLLWLRADVGVTASNGAVSQWADQSGNHFDARQLESAQQPTLAAAGLSGRSAVVFNADNFLALPTGFSDFSRGISLFVVADLADPGPCVGLLSLSNGGETDDIEIDRFDGKGSYEVLDGVLAGADFPLGRPLLISVVHDTDRNASMRFNGGQTATAMFDLPRLVTRLSNVVGRSLYADCGSMHGALAEILVYRRALDDTERTRVEDQLQSRWACCH